MLFSHNMAKAVTQIWIDSVDGCIYFGEGKTWRIRLDGEALRFECRKADGTYVSQHNMTG
jgi:hypothetical protein